MSIIKLILDNNWADLNKYVESTAAKKIKSKIDQKKTDIIEAINEGSDPEENNEDKRIVITYQTFSPESLESGDVEDQGWKDEEGESMIPDEYDYEDDITAVDKAIDFLKKNGANEPSSSHFNTGVWYSTSDPDIDYKSGNETYYSYHLKGFTPEEEQEIFQRIKRRN